MSNNSDEIMITLGMQDNASGVAESASSKIQSSLNKLNSSMMYLGQVSDNVMQSLTGKSAMDNIFATASKAETNNVLLTNMLDDAEKNFDSFYKKVDETTDKSIVSMQELIPALKAFKSATGATDEEMTNITESIANFGAAVLAQTGSTDMAQQSMMDLSKGVKGAFASLDQYGISEDALKRTGYWNGDEKDVEGFMKAVDKVTGSTEALMQTNQGLDALIGKSFSRAGKKIGNEFLPIIKDIKRGFIDLDDSMGGAIASAMLLGSAGIESGNRMFWNISTTVQGVKDLKDAFKALKGGKELASGLKTAGEVGKAASAAGPAMEAGAAGAEAASVGATGLSAAFTSMIVPLLALSAVIAIMIPIAAALAAEAMFFLKLLGDFMASLHFENINLDGAVKGLSSLTVALLWIGAAMLALTAVNITTSLAAVTSMFLGLTGPLEQATSALKKAAELLQGFNTISIDPSIAGKLQTIANSLVSVSTAMLALTSTNITTGFSDFVAWALGFGSVTDGLEQAKNDILTASTKLNEFKSITPLDEGIAKNIQNVCDSLASVGNAMSALRSIRDGQNWDDIFSGLMTGLFGEGVDIQTALLNVKDDIIQASQALAQFTGISEIPEDVSGKIQKVGDTLKTVSDAVTNIKNLVGSGFDNWVEGLFGGYDIAGGLEKIKNDLMIASQKLAELSGLSEVNEDITTKIQAVSNALAKVNEVSGTLVNLGSSGIGEFDSSIIATAVTNVQTAATELAKLNEITFDGAAADTILGAIQTTLENVKTTLAAASGFSEAATTIGSQIVSGVQSGLSPLGGTVIGIVDTAVIGAGGVALSGGASLGRSVNNGFKSTLDLHTIMSTEMDYVVDAVNNGIEAAKSAAQSGAQEVVSAFKSGINVGSPGDIARAMKQELIYTKDFILAAYAPLKEAAYTLGQNIVSGFGNPALNMDMFTNDNQLSAEYIGALKTTISRSPDKADNRPVTIIVSENAVNVDARNYTTKEAQGLMITAFEGLNSVNNIDVDI